MVTVAKKTYTPDEYFAWESQAQIRHEYRRGDMIPMPGGTPTHNEIMRMLVFLLTASLRQKPYCIFVSDQRLWIPATDQYTYPDVMVTPRPPELRPGRMDTVMNPICVAEILSESTEGYDRGDKFSAYRTIPTFQEYLLIAQDKVQVEHFIKQTQNEWLFKEYKHLSDVVMLNSLEVRLSLAELYETVEF
ncbi:MAG: Uma2 family endonuclease [Gloeomargarita sp. SKYG116]|nr:Uma2 family endonuclease [Gloeomargarita sp. SKYG116]MDW8400107.1 Uma2 family endonuclease [Gloeomargarita sp. SKYGB_i_bin116]